jgi:hypothetical protein
MGSVTPVSIVVRLGPEYDNVLPSECFFGMRKTRATITDRLYGFVLVHGHRSKRHSGRKPFTL